MPGRHRGGKKGGAGGRREAGPGSLMRGGRGRRRAWRAVQRGSGQAQPGGGGAVWEGEEARWERAVGCGPRPVPLFSAESAFNGAVEVREYGEGELRWRGLEFCAGGGEGLFQGLVSIEGGVPAPGGWPELGYVRVMAAALAFCADALSAGGDVLSVGLGAGSLTAVLKAAFPRGRPDLMVCEIDPEVVRAATLHLGFCGTGGDRKTQIYLDILQGRKDGGESPDTQGPRLWLGDGAACVATIADAVVGGRSPPLASILLDAFDGRNQIPASMNCNESDFLATAFSCLAPGGALVCNMQNGWWGSPERLAALDYLASIRSAEACDSVVACVPRDMPQNVVAVARKKGEAEPIRSVAAVKQAAEKLASAVQGAGGALPFDPVEELSSAKKFSVLLVGNLVIEKEIK